MQANEYICFLNELYGLNFSFIGLKTQELVISDTTPSFIEVTMLPDDIYIADAPLTNEQPYKKMSRAAKLWTKVKSVF